MYAYVLKDCSPIPMCILTISMFHNALLSLTDGIYSQICQVSPLLFYHTRYDISYGQI